AAVGQPVGLVELPLRGSLCGAPPPRPDVRRGIYLPTSLARVPAVTRFARPSGQPAAVTPVSHCLAEKIRLSQRIVRHILYHDPCPASRRAWLPDFFIGGLARLGRNKLQRLRRLCRSDIFVTILAGRPVYTALIFI